LRCEVDSYSNWTHFWYRDHNQTATSLTKEYSVNITGAAGSDQGQYWCEGRLEGRNVTSQRSDSITLTVAGRLVFGLGAAPLLLASIILCVKWCRKPGDVILQGNTSKNNVCFRFQAATLFILTPSSLPLLCLYMFVDVQGRLMKQLSNTLKRMWKLTYKTFTQKLDQCAHVE
ncbi:hypothetical protein ANANG_G00035010, partial [Anguilla anguilla]